tara:strand:- start:448 stop:888 length:441 start_codon:yes stop_codon:yes gene_type:complete
MLFDKILVILGDSSHDDVLAEEMGDLVRSSRGSLIAIRPKIISRNFPEDASINDLNIQADEQLINFAKNSKLKEGRRLKLENPQSRDLNSVISSFLIQESPDLLVIPFELIFNKRKQKVLLSQNRIEDILLGNRCSLLIWKHQKNI